MNNAQQIDNSLRNLIADHSTNAQSESNDLDKQAEQLLKLKRSGAPKQVIMDSLGITEDDYSKLVSRADVKAAILEYETNKASNSAIFDANWDSLENLAMQAVMSELRTNPDPEYALRVATTANKAIRRQREDAKLANQLSSANQPLSQTNVAIISLPKTFLQIVNNESADSVRRQLEVQRSALAEEKMLEVADLAITRDSLGLNRTPEQAKLINPREQPSGLLNSSGDSLDSFLTEMTDDKF